MLYQVFRQVTGAMVSPMFVFLYFGQTNILVPFQNLKHEISGITKDVELKH